MPRKTSLTRRRDFVLEAIRTLRSPGSAHRGVHLRGLEAVFRNKFGDVLAQTLDRMIKKTEVVAIVWKYEERGWRALPVDATILGAFPDSNYPDVTDPILYLPGELPRMAMKFVHRAPTLEVRRAIELRRGQAQRVHAENRVRRYGPRLVS